MAFEKGITIEELFLHAIWTSYMEFLNKGMLKPDKTIVEIDDTFRLIIMGEKNVKSISEYRR
jgi:hypothetical protein